MESIKINFGKYTALGSDWKRGSNIEAKGGNTCSSHIRALKPRWEGEETVGKSFKNRFESSFPLLKSIFKKALHDPIFFFISDFQTSVVKGQLLPLSRVCYQQSLLLWDLIIFLFSHIVSYLQLPNSNVLCIKP